MPEKSMPSGPTLTAYDVFFFFGCGTSTCSDLLSLPPFAIARVMLTSPADRNSWTPQPTRSGLPRSSARHRLFGPRFNFSTAASATRNARAESIDSTSTPKSCSSRSSAGYFSADSRRAVIFPRTACTSQRASQEHQAACHVPNPPTHPGL